MMWAPIANNVIAILVLVLYLVWFGPLAPADGYTAYTSTQELVLGLGATLGIAVQVLVLLPYLKAAGVHFRPRYDFRHSGLGHTLRLGVWTVLFVVVNQVAYTVVVRLASGGTAPSGCGLQSQAPANGTGYTVYAAAFLFVMVPHAIITVSLATAILPRLSAKAADGDLTGLAGTLAGTLRTALAIVIPFAFLLPLVAYDAAKVLFGYGATCDDVRPLRHVDDPVRPGRRVLHRALPDAARLLRPRAEPPGLLRAVRDRGHQRGGGSPARVACERPADVAGARPGLRGVVRAGREHLLPAAARTAGWPRDRRAGAVPGPPASSRPSSRPPPRGPSAGCCRAAGTTSRT